MKLLIVLCLGTLTLSAPAPQKRNQIDFLFDDDETQASVRPVESSTVEPKVTASKISDPRKPAPVFEREEVDEEEEANVQEQEPSPIASPLNLEPGESDNSEPSVRVNETDNDDLENKNETKSTTTDSTDSSMTDTTIRVYDDDEVDGTTQKEERLEQDNEQGEEQEQEQDRELDQASIDENDQKAVVNDSYQYDDESFEKEYQSEESPEKTTTAIPEPSYAEPTTNGDLNVGLNHETQIAEKGSFGISDVKATLTIPLESDDTKDAELVKWSVGHQEPATQDDLNVELKTGQVFNHGTLFLEKGIFDGKDANNPFTGGPFPMKYWKMGEKPDFANWPHGPYGPFGPFGPHGEPHFPGSHNEQHRFEGPPPPWVHGHHFHPPRFDHKSHDDKGYFFHGNGFHQNVPAWERPWENRNPVPTTTERAALSE